MGVLSRHYSWEDTKDEFRGGAVPIAAKLVLTLGAHE